MKLATFEVDTALGAQRRVGAITNAAMVDVTAARVALLDRSLPSRVAARVGNAQLPPDMIRILECGQIGVDWAREAVEFVLSHGVDKSSENQLTIYAEANVRILAPVPRPPGIACFTTWEEHIKASEARGGSVRWIPPGSEIRSYYKGNPDSVIGTGVVLAYPSYAEELDMECELAAIVGTGGKDLSVDDARHAIAGYSVYNDVSVRDIQRREMRCGLGPAKGKDHDGGNVLGPWLVTADEVGDPRTLTLSMHVNGEEWSSHSTSEMAWDFAELLSYLSRGQTVLPGQVLTSGSYPRGCGADLGRKFAPGDTVEMRATRIGSIVNVVGSPEANARRLIG